jgi:orotidine-5'-phosphate decarboxylase
MKNPKDYIVFPLDFSDHREALSYVDILKDHVGIFKVGLELFIAQGPEILKEIRNVTEAGIFLDLKLHDIPATVKRAFMAASAYQPRFITVHCDEGGDVLRDVAESNQGNTQILAITVLTSLDQKKLEALGYHKKYTEDLSALVLLRASMAMEAGCHGIVCSGHEVSMVKKEVSRDLIAITPGIRPAWSVVDQDDQKRVVTPAQAVKRGADYIVIGRPIRDAADPRKAAVMTAKEIESAL